MLKAKIVFLVGTLALPLLCGAQESGFSISPFWGYRFGDEILETSKLSSPGGITVADHSDYGLRADYDPSRQVSVEVQASRVESDLVDSSTSVRFRIRDDDYLALARVSFPGPPVTPYVALGAGVSRLDTVFVGSTALLHETRNYFAGTFATGLDWSFSRRWGVRLDGRLYATDVRGDLIGTPCTTFEPNSEGAIVPMECPRKNWMITEEASLALVVRF